jgi:SPOR domain
MRHEKSTNSIYLLRSIFSNMPFRIGLLMCHILILSISVKATNEIIEIELNPIVTFDYVPVDFIVNAQLKFATDVVISESNKVYISIEELFENLGIKCISENEGNNLRGFIDDDNHSYTIDYNAKHIVLGDRTIKTVNGFLKESGKIYIESTVITEAFGLNIIFNYRSLSIKMEANFELPIIKQMRLEQMRKNISKLQNREIIADTIVKRNYHLFKFGTVDWSINSYQIINESSNNVIRSGVGTELFYGQANVLVNYNDRYKFDNRSLQYDWRWIDNDKNIIKQAQLGKISHHSIAFINSPVVGASINNTPNTVRKASGYYTINEYTEPNWTVELYINDILVDYTEADASGLFVFKVPNVYGYTSLKLKFYGPMGEERIEERTMNVPFTFMPAKTLEYSLSGGILEDGKKSSFGRGDFSYGVNRFITLGGGVEYLSSITTSPFIPFAKVAIQAFSKLVVNLEYAYDVKMQGLLSYNFGQSAFLEIDYTNYVKEQMAVLFKPDEELKVRLSVPLKLNKVSGFAKLKYNQNLYDDAFKYNKFDAIFSAYYKNFNANLSTRINWVSENEPYITSTLALSYRMKNGLILRPLAEYNISNSELLRCKVEIVKRVGKANFSVSYERNFAYKTDYVFVGFRYDLNFARVGADAYYTNNKIVISEAAQGSIAFGGDNNYVKTGNNSALSKGGILFYPFLDLNHNGTFDKGEQMVLLTNVRVSGGRAIISEKDSIVRVSDLNAFINYTVEFSDDDLDHIAWRFKHKTYQVLVDPNQYKRVYVPVLSVGEVTGMVYFDNENMLNGLGRITVQIYNQQGNLVAETLSESDGYFSYLGLMSGDYTVRVDEEQLEKLGYQSTPLFHNLLIKELIDGDIVDGLEFVLKTKENRVGISSVQQNIVPQQTAITPAEIKKDSEEIKSANKTKPSVLEDVNSEIPLTNDSINLTIIVLPIKSNLEYSFVWGDICDKPGYFYVQCGAFRIKSNALNFALKIKQLTSLNVGVVLTDDYYKVQIECLNNKNKANNFKVELIKKLEINGIFIRARNNNNANINSGSINQLDSDSIKTFEIDSLHLNNLNFIDDSFQSKSLKDGNELEGIDSILTKIKK